MKPTDDPDRAHALDLSAGECCAQAQMASFARIEAERRAREQARTLMGSRLLRLLAQRFRLGKG
mgnify:CR=1 FL=1